VGPCVILYLVAVIPPVWIAEFDLVIIYRVPQRLRSTDASEDAAFLIGHGRRNLSAHPEKRRPHSDGGDPAALCSSLAAGFLPRQQISKEQKSALLIGYIGMSADILELYEYFKDDRRRVGGNPSQLRQPSLSQHGHVAIVCNLLLQDATVLAVRFYLLVKYAIVSETSVFFLGEEQPANLLSSCTGFTRLICRMRELNGARIASFNHPE
uniref:CPSF_A domain-containing protein n=1 Tax=Macrostomum lignano TaxID=282301 RepID=A0A1I8JPJ8_9PLAT